MKLTDLLIATRIHVMERPDQPLPPELMVSLVRAERIIEIIRSGIDIRSVENFDNDMVNIIKAVMAVEAMIDDR